MSRERVWDEIYTLNGIFSAISLSKFSREKQNKDAKTVHVIDLPAIEELVMMVNGQTHLMKLN